MSFIVLGMPTTTAATVTQGVDDIRKRRERIGVSRLTLAAESGLSVTHVQNVEGGVIPKRGQAVTRLLAALGRLEAHLTSETDHAD